MIYLASPYSTPIQTVLEERVNRTLEFTMLCIGQGLTVFSPIVYFHHMAVVMQVPTDAVYWHAHNMQFLRKAEAIFALHLMGWDQSKGMKVELGLAKTLGIPVVHYEGTAPYKMIEVN